MKLLFLVAAMAAVVYVAYLAVQSTTAAAPAPAGGEPAMATPRTPAQGAAVIQNITDTTRKTLEDEARRVDDAAK